MKITTTHFVCLIIFVVGLVFALGAYVGALVSEKTTTVVTAGHLQCKLDKIKMAESLIGAATEQADTLVKMHEAKSALADTLVKMNKAGSIYSHVNSYGDVIEGSYKRK